MPASKSAKKPAAKSARKPAAKSARKPAAGLKTKSSKSSKPAFGSPEWQALYGRGKKKPKK